MYGKGVQVLDEARQVYVEVNPGLGRKMNGSLGKENNRESKGCERVGVGQKSFELLQALCHRRGAARKEIRPELLGGSQGEKRQVIKRESGRST